ncbi:hypothetical protein E2I00_008278, partial [Balaenoptera physalus]
ATQHRKSFLHEAGDQNKVTMTLLCDMAVLSDCRGLNHQANEFSSQQVTPESLTSPILIYFQVKSLLLLTLGLTLLGEVAARKTPKAGDPALCPAPEDHTVRVDIRILRQTQGALLSHDFQNRSSSPWDYKYGCSRSFRLEKVRVTVGCTCVTPIVRYVRGLRAADQLS